MVIRINIREDCNLDPDFAISAHLLSHHSPALGQEYRP